MTDAMSSKVPSQWQVPGSWLSPERLEELRPRLEALLADFAHLQLEPIPGFRFATAENASNE